MKVLVTGAGGFIGTHLIERLAPEHEVYALARHPLDLPSVRWIAHDLTQPLERADLPREIDAVIHLAQSRHYREFPEQATDIFNINIRSTFELLDYARQIGVSHFMYASSGGIYGRKDDDFIETDQVNPLNFYLASKYVSEVIIAPYRQFFHTLVCRFFFVYGAHQNPNMLIPRLVRSIMQGQPVILQGSDGIRINPTYVGDAVEAFSQALTVDGQHIVNIAGPQILSLREIANIIGACIGREPIFEVQEVENPNHLVGDITRMKVLISEPKTSFADGVAEVCREVLAREHN